MFGFHTPSRWIKFQQTTKELTIFVFVSKSLEKYLKGFKVTYWSSFNIISFKEGSELLLFYLFYLMQLQLPKRKKYISLPQTKTVCLYVKSRQVLYKQANPYTSTALCIKR